MASIDLGVRPAMYSRSTHTGAAPRAQDCGFRGFLLVMPRHLFARSRQLAQTGARSMENGTPSGMPLRLRPAHSEAVPVPLPDVVQAVGFTGGGPLRNVENS